MLDLYAFFGRLGKNLAVRRLLRVGSPGQVGPQITGRECGIDYNRAVFQQQQIQAEFFVDACRRLIVCLCRIRVGAVRGDCRFDISLCCFQSVGVRLRRRVFNLIGGLKFAACRLRARGVLKQGQAARLRSSEEREGEHTQ